MFASCICCVRQYAVVLWHSDVLLLERSVRGRDLVSLGAKSYDMFPGSDVNMSWIRRRFGFNARFCWCVTLQSTEICRSFRSDLMTCPVASAVSATSFEHCSPCWFSVIFRRLTDLLEERVVVLDSPCCGASFDSSFRCCGWLERNHEVAASFVRSGSCVFAFPFDSSPGLGELQGSCVFAFPFDSSPGLGELQGLPGYSTGLGVDPAGGAPGGV
ncbi:kinesin-4-like [Dorcoceras hygrometricum]|uniref:Kinesin-4-like n=1 Tax=Dorcoceras hygrometricum TaxID=472368 RepID=A0A2Z7D5H5_9LAMI|nr:kinesin-4-like [Dorcoceras hygrometricum]